jgi:hypothetical protein
MSAPKPLIRPKQKFVELITSVGPLGRPTFMIIGEARNSHKGELDWRILFLCFDRQTRSQPERPIPTYYTSVDEVWAKDVPLGVLSHGGVTPPKPLSFRSSIAISSSRVYTITSAQNKRIVTLYGSKCLKYNYMIM